MIKVLKSPLEKWNVITFFFFASYTLRDFCKDSDNYDDKIYFRNYIWTELQMWNNWINDYIILNCMNTQWNKLQCSFKYILSGQNSVLTF